MNTLIAMLTLGVLSFGFMVAFVHTLWKYRDAKRSVDYMIEMKLRAEDARHDHQYRCEICYKTPEQEHG